MNRMLRSLDDLKYLLLQLSLQKEDKDLPIRNLLLGPIRGKRDFLNILFRTF